MKLLPDLCQILYIHFTSIHLHDTKLYCIDTTDSFHNSTSPPQKKQQQQAQFSQSSFTVYAVYSYLHVL